GSSSATSSPAASTRDTPKASSSYSWRIRSPRHQASPGPGRPRNRCSSSPARRSTPSTASHAADGAISAGGWRVLSTCCAGELERSTPPLATDSWVSIPRLRPHQILDCVVTGDGRELVLSRRGDVFHIHVDRYELMASRA